MTPQDVSSWMKVIGIAIPFGGIFGFIIAICLVLFALPKIEAVISVICKLLSFLGPFFKKNAVAKDLRSRIIQVSGKINREIGTEIVPNDLKIKWVKEEDLDSFLQHNQVVVLIRYSPNPTANVVKAVTQFVTRGLVPHAKKHLDPVMSRSLDLAITRKLLDASYNDAIPYFIEKILNPIISSDEELRQLVDSLFSIDGAGMLTQILIRELVLRANTLTGQPPDEALRVETRQFTKFLYNIAMRKVGDPYIDTDFRGVYYNISIVIVGLREKLEKCGISGHLNAIKIRLGSGFATVYVLCGCDKKIYLSEIINNIKNDIRVKRYFTFPFAYRMANGQKARGICLRISTETTSEEDILAV
ncbi:MAG: hypothetical protein K6U03_00860 [Firmicutes bacterium]|nr:hypothetical protein [Bacillota bacterium]